MFRAGRKGAHRLTLTGQDERMTAIQEASAAAWDAVRRTAQAGFVSSHKQGDSEVAYSSPLVQLEMAQRLDQVARQQSTPGGVEFSLVEFAE